VDGWGDVVGERQLVAFDVKQLLDIIPKNVKKVNLYKG